MFVADGSDDDAVSVRPEFSTSGMMVPTLPPGVTHVGDHNVTHSAEQSTPPGSQTTTTVPATTQPGLCVQGKNYKDTQLNRKVYCRVGSAQTVEQLPVFKL